MIYKKITTAEQLENEFREMNIKKFSLAAHEKILEILEEEYINDTYELDVIELSEKFIECNVYELFEIFIETITFPLDEKENEELEDVKKNPAKHAKDIIDLLNKSDYRVYILKNYNYLVEEY